MRSLDNNIDIERRFGITNFIDRRNDNVYCLLCFVEFDYQDFDDHLNSEFHQTLIKVTEKLKDGENMGKATSEEKTSLKNELCDENITDKMVEENNTNVGNEESNLNGKSKSSHEFDSKISKTEEDLSNLDVKASVSTAKETVDLKEYAKDNYIRYRKENKQALCELCNVYISGNIHNITEHVNGGTHKKLKAKKSIIHTKQKAELETVVYKTKPWSKFADSVEVVRDEFSNVVGFFINRQFFIERTSFALLKPISSHFYKCEACDTMVFQAEASVHLDNDIHDAYMKSPVVIFDNEFIREVKPGSLFQCGFCNEYFNSWTLMQKHLKTFQHSSSRQESAKVRHDILTGSRDPTNILVKLVAMAFISALQDTDSDDDEYDSDDY